MPLIYKKYNSMILNILFMFLIFIKKSISDVDLNQNTYLMTFSSYFEKSPKKIILKSKDSLETVLYENNSENKFFFDLPYIVSVGDSIIIQFSNSNENEENNSIKFAFIIIIENSKGNKNLIFHNQTNINYIGEITNIQVYLNGYLVNISTINQMEISFTIPKIYQCKNNNFWLGKNEIISLNLNNYFEFYLDEKIEIDSFNIEYVKGSGQLSYINDENIEIPINSLVTINTNIIQFKTNQDYSYHEIIFSNFKSNNEQCTLKIHSCNEICRKCENKEICEECVDGYYLFDSKCYKIVNENNQVVSNLTSILQIYNLKSNNNYQNPNNIFDNKSNVKPSNITLIECINHLIEINYISKGEDIIIVKEDSLKEDNYYNDVKYFIYDKNGKKIDINYLCINKKISISYSLNNNSLFDFIKNNFISFNKKKQNFNINWCNIHSIKKKVVSLEQIKNYHFRIGKFCEGCIFNNYSISTNNLNCICQINNKTSNDITLYKETSGFIANKIFQCSISLIKQFSFNNIGFWIIIISILFIIILCFTTNYEIKKYGEKVILLYKEVFQNNTLNCLPNPIKKRNSLHKSFDDIKTEELSSKKTLVITGTYNSSSSDFHELSSKEDNYLNKIKSKITFNDFEINFNQNQKKNKKKTVKETINFKLICFIFYQNLTNFSLIYNFFFPKNIFIIRSMILALFIFEQNLLLLLHGLFFNEEKISKKINKIKFNDDLLFSFIISCIVFIIYFLMKRFINYPLKYENLKLINTKRKDFEKYAVFVLMIFKILLIIYYSIIFIILLFSLLYLTLFSIKLQNNLMILFIGVLISDLFYVILKIICTLIITIFNFFYYIRDYFYKCKILFN